MSETRRRTLISVCRGNRRSSPAPPVELAARFVSRSLQLVDICAVAAPNLVYPPSTPEELDETGKMIAEQERRWIGVKGDIRDMSAMRSAVDHAIKEFGKLDIAVANAAIQIYGPLAGMSDENWKNVIDVNLNGTANTLRAVLPHMLQRKFGRIVIIASGQGRHGFKNGSAYSASKWGVIGLMNRQHGKWRKMA